ncbi:MAG TPA: glycogen debranching enzyme GlgX, partial [Salinarimonas sp.]|nr:glycogen debranching enzyme GlgX [Salinarimonas sp.]
LDSLRHWVEAYRVDGFRFDLATTLGRNPFEFDERAAILQAASADPVLSRVKLIAEPWDVGSGGYRVGGFPPGWSEWNDQFRDHVRAFWRGDPGEIGHLARVVTGCGEIFAPRRRHPTASVNFVTAHDGFTLHDLVSYEAKRNEANGENNQDGHNHNLSWNCGVEGETDDPAILSLRARQKRNLLATLFLAQGVPMILMGDEISRSQGGNNNAYAQDNAISWMRWEPDPRDPDLPAFVQALSGLRRRYAAFRRRDFLTGAPVRGNRLKDIYWLGPEGREMTHADWSEPERRVLGLQLGNDAPDRQRFLVLINAGPDPVDFALPADFPLGGFAQVFDTRIPDGIVRERPAVLNPGGVFALEPRMVALFQHAPSIEIP